MARYNISSMVKEDSFRIDGQMSAGAVELVVIMNFPVTWLQIFIDKIHVHEIICMNQSTSTMQMYEYDGV